MNFLALSSSPAAEAAGIASRVQLPAGAGQRPVAIPGISARTALPLPPPVNPHTRRRDAGLNHRLLHNAQCRACCQSKGG